MAEDCVEIEVLAAYVERNLSPQERQEVEAHLVRCRVCRQVVARTLRTRAEIPDPVAREEDKSS